jgi:acetamidase/formamidase
MSNAGIASRAGSQPKLHTLPATPANCFWGFFDNSLAPVLQMQSGDVISVETLTHQAGDAPDLMMDDGVRRVYEAIPMSARGPGVHIMTGPIYVHDAQPGDTLEVRILGFEPRLPYGSNIAAWWGGLYDEFHKERITIYRVEGDSWARAAFAFDYRSSPRYDAPGTIIAPDPGSREPALTNVRVPLRPHLGVMGVAPKERGRINSIPPADFGGNIDNWRIGPGAIMYYPVFNPGALFFAGDPHLAEGDGELSGTAIEASANILLQLFVRKDLRTDHPILETASHWFTHGFDEDLNLAMKQAALKMLDFLTARKGLSRDEAYSLMSVAVDFGVTQVVDQRKGIHAAVPKNLFGTA